MNNYIILEASTSTELVTKVNNYIQQDFVSQGGVSTISTGNYVSSNYRGGLEALSPNSFKHQQAMYKPPEVKLKEL